jgi:hypothetical protein
MTSDVQTEFIKSEFKKAYKLASKIFRASGDPLSCEIHDYFSSSDSHNCIGCNMATSENHIINFLKRYNNHKDIEESYNQYLILCYLMVERIYEIFKIIEIPETYRLKHFKTFNLIKKWGNFIKHPKAFILVHHPICVLENSVGIEKLKKKSIQINSKFIEKYYSGEKNNRELYNILTNKRDVVVIYPELEGLTKSFCQEVRRFVDLIRDNSVYREILNDKATYEYFYSLEDLEGP